MSMRMKLTLRCQEIVATDGTKLCYLKEKGKVFQRL